MGTQTEIVEKIREKRVDYVLAKKKNQRNLYEEVVLYFEEKEAKEKIQREETTEK